MKLKIDGESELSERKAVLALERDGERVKLVTYWEGNPTKNVLFCFTPEGKIIAKNSEGSLFERDEKGYPVVIEC